MPGPLGSEAKNSERTLTSARPVRSIGRKRKALALCPARNLLLAFFPRPVLSNLIVMRKGRCSTFALAFNMMLISGFFYADAFTDIVVVLDASNILKEKGCYDSICSGSLVTMWRLALTYALFGFWVGGVILGSWTPEEQALSEIEDTKPTDLESIPATRPKSASKASPNIQDEVAVYHEMSPCPLVADAFRRDPNMRDCIAGNDHMDNCVGHLFWYGFNAIGGFPHLWFTGIQVTFLHFYYDTRALIASLLLCQFYGGVKEVYYDEQYANILKIQKQIFKGNSGGFELLSNVLILAAKIEGKLGFQALLINIVSILLSLYGDVTAVYDMREELSEHYDIPGPWWIGFTINFLLDLARTVLIGAFTVWHWYMYLPCQVVCRGLTSYKALNEISRSGRRRAAEAVGAPRLFI